MDWVDDVVYLVYDVEDGVVFECIDLCVLVVEEDVVVLVRLGECEFFWVSVDELMVVVWWLLWLFVVVVVGKYDVILLVLVVFKWLISELVGCFVLVVIVIIWVVVGLGLLVCFWVDL